MYKKINDEILHFFPDELRREFGCIEEHIWNNVKEIRIRIGQPILIVCFDKEIIVEHKICTEEILRLLENFSDNSIYAIQNEINNGYLTIKGGHRIGISGTSIFEDNKIKNIKYISSLNIRVAREVKDCGINIVKRIVKNEFSNTIILSAPRMWEDNLTTRYYKDLK